MAQAVQANIVILWEHELTAAAKALGAADAAAQDKSLSDSDVSKLYAAALQACHAAIYSPELAAGCQVAVLSAKRAVMEAEPIKPQ